MHVNFKPGTERSAACIMPSFRDLRTSLFLFLPCLDQSSSCTCRTSLDFMFLMRSFCPQRSFAIFMISAAVPWIGEFIATRSPNCLCIKLLEDSSGTGLLLPNKGHNISLFFCTSNCIIQKFLDARMGFKITVNIFGRFFSRNANPGSVKGTDPINNTKVDCFCISPLQIGHFIKRSMETPEKL